MHRYNTRFQSKKAALAQQALPQQASTQVPKLSSSMIEGLSTISPNHVEKTKELVTIKSYLQRMDDVVNPPSRINKLSMAVEMFHYMEHHTTFLRMEPRFRNIVLIKCNEFIHVADAEEATVHKYDQAYCDKFITLNAVLDQVRIATIAKLLRETCMRVRNIIENQL
jgi:hypothetical protein